jgi:predicted ATPase
LRATLDWSWGLLSPDEQNAFMQLVVFEGGITLDAAAAVIATYDGSAWVPDLVQALVEKSLASERCSSTLRHAAHREHNR